MRRFLGLVVLTFFALPFGLSMAGCGHKAAAVQYCNANTTSGPVLGEVATITLAANLSATGESLNYGQIGTSLSATAQDCKGTAVTVAKFVYATTDMSIADINPSSGSVCAGTWNRNTGGGISDYTYCTPPASSTSHTAYITASANGATSNPIAVYVHAPVTGVVLGSPSKDCTNDPATNCCPFNTTGTTINAPAYDGSSCLSQGTSGQLVARVYSSGDTLPQHNISCQAGPVAFNLQGATNVATINTQGIATANQPGSALITATVSNSSSALNSGFISTCPPVSIQLTAVNQPANASSINVALNTSQAFTATVLDKNNVALTGVALEFNSTLPVNFPASSGSVTPAYPGTATITAVCQPGTCNPAPFSQIGYLGNGNPITSNGITVTAAGTASEVLYMGSTDSLYIASEDFTTGQLSSPIKLAFLPNSMVISQDGSTIYVGSQQGLTTINTASNSIAGTYATVQGTVLAVAPNNSYAVVTDPTRQTVSLVTPSGAIASSFNGVGTRAEWTPDSNTLYVATSSNQLLTYSTFIGWESTTIDETQYNDVAITVPAVGAYFAGPNATEGRTYCPSTTLGSGTPPAATNVFSPLAQQLPIPTDRLAATTDGKHILGVTASPAALQDIAVSLPTTTVNGTTTIAACPAPPAIVSPGYFTSTFSTHPLTGLTPTAVTGVVPASNSSAVFVTYTGSGSVLPLYVPSAGTVNDVALTNGATAPVAGVFSTDDTTFYAGTSGDNQVHIITLSGNTGKDTGVIAPSLPKSDGTPATPNLLAQRARRTTS